MKWQRTAGNVLIFLGGLALIGSAGAKFAQVPQVVSELNGFGFQGKLMLIATGEALSALLFLLPPTRSIGVLLVSALLGGAIATHMQHGQSYVGPAGLLVLVWLGAWLRHPETLWSLTQAR
ncbi:MAG: DoxX family protein [Gemmatimonadetes bacterium]|nr:MAG: DoxX family protein [Gemmatimonadota bacterium]